MSMVPNPITVHWRPGCPYCIRLRSRLHRAGVHADDVNIRDDPSDAAFVRSVTGRDETVPTVRIGDQALVNPPPGCVIEQIRDFDPSLVGPTGGRALSAEPLRVAQWVVISLLIAVSLAVDATCHPTLSAGADVIAIVVYVVFRSLRMRLARRESDDRVVVEGNHHFPLEDVNMEFLDESPTHGLFVEGGSELLHRPCGRKAEYRCGLVLAASVPGGQQGLPAGSGSGGART